MHQTLQEDISRFESHLDSRRTAIRSAISDLTKVVEDPSSLRSTEKPSPSEMSEVDEADYSKIEIDSPSLNELEGHPSDPEPEQEQQPPTPDTEITVSAEDLASSSESAAPEAEVVEAEPEENEPIPAMGNVQDFDDEDVTLSGDEVLEPEQQPQENTAVLQDPAPVTSGGDPFLAELRRVTSEDPQDGDPIADFLEDETSNSNSGGWFGRRK